MFFVMNSNTVMVLILERPELCHSIKTRLCPLLSIKCPRVGMKLSCRRSKFLECTETRVGNKVTNVPLAIVITRLGHLTTNGVKVFETIDAFHDSNAEESSGQKTEDAPS